jgi:hypothetical protein
MLVRIGKDKNQFLDDQIKRVLDEMDQYGPDSPEYKVMIKYLERLVRLKTKNRPERINRNTMAIVVGNVVGILIIVIYEQKHVLVSKGLAFILKPR